jgi:hypothetical protein
MEFFAHIKKSVTPERLQQEVAIKDIPRFCAFVSEIRPDEQGELEMISFWGVHTVHRELIKGGVRFSLPGCPNVLSWTITTDLPPNRGVIVLHCVINRQDHDPDFIESIEGFVDDWKTGLESQF